jgi:hypothetical protein
VALPPGVSTRVGCKDKKVKDKLELESLSSSVGTPTPMVRVPHHIPWVLDLVG